MKEEKLVNVVPSKRQLEHQKTEFYAFVHFTVNTYTNLEWGTGKESEKIFNPILFDANQWVSSVKEAGMKGLILTCKHHDGFCLWPSEYTEHSVKNSPFRDGKGDIVREVSDACRKKNIKFGVYLSPWDRNYPLYGTGKPYDDYFVNQLTELLSNYGEIFSVWFDGACGEGLNGKKQYYDWDRYYETIRKLQPNACISVCGPDVRWCGNEAGHTRESEWSVVPKRTRDTEKIAENSQQNDDTEFRERKISAHDEDLGSREALENETELVWYPAEVNTSIRPGWFYHESEDDKVRPLSELKDIYLKSVGGNATFLLNIPPTRNGLFHKNDVDRLGEIGYFIRSSFKNNLLAGAKLLYEGESANSIENVRKDDYDSFFEPKEKNAKKALVIELDEEKTVNYLVMKENVLKGQRIEKFVVTNEDDEILYSATTVGYKRIAVLNGQRVRKIKIYITESRMTPTLSFIGLY